MAFKKGPCVGAPVSSETAGRFTLEDVESVCTSSVLSAAETLDMLTSLVDRLR
jgi:hypothetical protein